MAFSVHVVLRGEFRRRKEVHREKGTYRSFTVEDAEGNTNEVSVRQAELWEDVVACTKGSYYEFPVSCVATEKYSFITLDDTPVYLADEEGEVE